MMVPALMMALAAPALMGQTAATPAADLIKAALTEAKGQRTVMLAFHASWCSWCRRLEATLARPAVKEIMDRHFVFQWLTIQERGPKQVLDNPGAAELYQAWTGGVQAGIPFCVVLDGQGKMHASSIRALAPGQAAENLGYPGSPEEIKAFIALLKDGAPSLSPAEQATLAQELEAASPKK
jgi:thiol-disulfide isomerase/thioredoxin